MIVTVVDSDLKRPLLHKQRCNPVTSQSHEAEKEPRVDLHFRRHFVVLLRLLRPFPALLLAVLSIVESVAVAEVGRIAGTFYKIVVDDQPRQLANTMLHAAALYTACCAVYALATFVAQRLAVGWRDRLTHHLQQLYCRAAAFYQLQQEGLDNPDQRIAFDAAALCESLGSVVKVALAAPFKVCYYCWLTSGYLGWKGLAAVFAFFWMGAALQRLVMAPVARAVWKQEAREGDLRFAHLRLREYAVEVALCGGGGVEGERLQEALAAAVGNQRRLVLLRTVLAATTRGIDYCGAMLNYMLVAAAVFAGAAHGEAGGQLAEWVSNASFATLMLIYSFTELLDLSQQLSSMAGLTARVGQLLDALEQVQAGGGVEREQPVLSGDCLSSPDGLGCCPGVGGSITARRPGDAPPQGVGGPRGRGGLGGGRPRASWWVWLRLMTGRGRGGRGGEGYSALAGEEEWRGRAAGGAGGGEQEAEMAPSDLAHLVLPPTTSTGALPDGTSLEYSIHRLGRDLLRELPAIFPDQGHAHGAVPASCLQHPHPPVFEPAEEVQAASGKGTSTRGGGKQGVWSAPLGSSTDAGEGRQAWRGQRDQGVHRTAHEHAQQGQRLVDGGRGRGGLEGSWGEEAQVLAVLTFQFAAGGISLSPIGSGDDVAQAAAEMDRMLDNFLRWERAVRVELSQRGAFWCNAVDPRTGYALHGARGSRWSEVTAAHSLLGYDRVEDGVCPVVLHPRHGTAAYPVTLFTDAPLLTLLSAMDAAGHHAQQADCPPPPSLEGSVGRLSLACRGTFPEGHAPALQHPCPPPAQLAGPSAQADSLPSGATPPPPASRPSSPPPQPEECEAPCSALPVAQVPGDPAAVQPPPPSAQRASCLARAPAPPPLLELRDVTLCRPDGGTAVSHLSLTLPRGSHLLISGPNGCGKSTLVKALVGLYPLESGLVRVCGLPAAMAAATAPRTDAYEVGMGPAAGDGPRSSSLGSAGGSALGGLGWVRQPLLDGCVEGGEACTPVLGPHMPAAMQPTAVQAAHQPDVMVVPQRPLAAPGGGLWQQVVYPDSCPPPREHLRRLLAAVGLGYLEARGSAGTQGSCGVERGASTGWAGMMSPGELQRLSVARVLHRRPALALLDEVTASVSPEAATQLYSILQDAGVGCVSVGQDCAHLRAMHTHHLRLGLEGQGGDEGQGAWELRVLQPGA